MEYHEYPKWLQHPAMQPAIISDDATRARPLQLGPVLVHSPQQEEEYLAKGYTANGTPNPKAFNAVWADRETTEVKHDYQEYPKWIRTGTNATGDPMGIIVRNEDEEFPGRAKKKAKIAK